MYKVDIKIQETLTEESFITDSYEGVCEIVMFYLEKIRNDPSNLKLWQISVINTETKYHQTNCKFDLL